MARAVLTAALLAAAPAAMPAQSRVTWSATGDTAGAPAGCSASKAIQAIDGWFSAFNAADSAGLATTLAFPFTVSTGGTWRRDDVLRRFDDSVDDVAAYARERKLYGERLAVDSVRFGGWRGALLHFQVFFDRSASDLSGTIPGLGRAVYTCNRGIRLLTMAPDPVRWPPRQRALHAVRDTAGVRITFLANAGVMLTGGGRKVLIDALYRPYAGYAAPDERVQAQLALGRRPFDGVDAILVTHYHGDHFEPLPVVRHLRANPGAVLVAPQQVIDSLRAAGNSIHDHQLRAYAMAAGTRRRQAVNGVGLDLLGIPHGGRRHRGVGHLGFIVELGGRRVLHIGDADISGEAWARLRLDTARVDVALVPYWALLDEDARAVIARYIRPKQIVAIHADAGDREGRDIERRVRAVLPHATTLFRSLESRSW